MLQDKELIFKKNSAWLLYALWYNFDWLLIIN